MLNSIKTYETYDKEEVSFGIERIPEQIHLAWVATRELASVSGKDIANVLLVGMGGSSLAAHALISVFEREAKIPVSLVHDYQIPAYVNSKTLVVLTSFSGNTEEVLSCAEQAKTKKAKLAVVTSGGKLAAFALKEKALTYLFAPGDLAKTPNLGFGFMFGGTLGLLERYGILKMSQGRIAKMLAAMSDVVDSCAINVDAEANPAKTVAEELHGKPLLLVASEHLAGNVHATSNMINEIAKQFSSWTVLPELNHHLMESLERPSGLFGKFGVLMVRSKLYHARTQLRYELTAELFEKFGATVIDYEARGKDPLEEVGELMQFGSFLTYYLTMLNKVSPTALPYVTYFKKKLG